MTIESNFQIPSGYERGIRFGANSGYSFPGSGLLARGIAVSILVIQVGALDEEFDQRADHSNSGHGRSPVINSIDHFNGPLCIRSQL